MCHPRNPSTTKLAEDRTKTLDDIQTRLDRIKRLKTDLDAGHKQIEQEIKAYQLPNYEEYNSFCRLKADELSLNPHLVSAAKSFQSNFSQRLTKYTLASVQNEMAVKSTDNNIINRRSLEQISIEIRTQSEDLRKFIYEIESDLELMSFACTNYLIRLEKKIKPYLDSLSKPTLHKLAHDSSPMPYDINSYTPTSTNISSAAIIKLHDEITPKMNPILFNKISHTVNLLETINAQINLIQRNKAANKFNTDSLLTCMKTILDNTDPTATIRKEVSSHQRLFNRTIKRNPDTSEGGKLMITIREIAERYPRNYTYTPENGQEESEEKHNTTPKRK